MAPSVSGTTKLPDDRRCAKLQFYIFFPVDERISPHSHDLPRRCTTFASIAHGQSAIVTRQCRAWDRYISALPVSLALNKVLPCNPRTCSESREHHSAHQLHGPLLRTSHEYMP